MIGSFISPVCSTTYREKGSWQWKELWYKINRSCSGWILTRSLVADNEYVNAGYSHTKSKIEKNRTDENEEVEKGELVTE